VNETDPTEAARAMLKLTERERNAAIEAADNVADLRPSLNHKRRQRELAAQYREAFKRRGPYA
jgi:hypothetical protein